MKEFYSVFNSIVSFTGYLGKTIANLPVKDLRNMIIATRNFLNLNIKPLEAIKLARNINIAATIVGIFADLKEVWDKHKFEQEKEKFIQEIDQFFNNLIELITYENFFDPLIKLEQKVIEYQKAFQEHQKILQEHEHLELFFEKEIKELSP